MSATYFQDDGVKVCISDKAYQLYADEQRLTRLDRLYVEVKLGSVFGAVLSIAGLVLLKIWG
jgi:hypothetical protein